ncbi:MAG: HAMP domain-containing sensor histidine kinase [Candidatus Borkfalkiaceae bacterium]|nr:HAMP domain-containing sensor histidine kinase [Clostridia bacterium]MDY6222972.1 HAMP domain-containing sensor histidine kinase [Christensenellaceae bacterium]
MKATKKRKERKKSSIYFVLWAAFTAFSLVIVLLFGFSQGASVKDTYSRAAMEDTLAAGNGVKKNLQDKLNRQGISGAFTREFFWEQSSAYNVRALLLDGDGNVLLPDEDSASAENFFEVTAELIARLGEENAPFALAKTDEECVYACSVYADGEEYFLVVWRQLALNKALFRAVNGRTVLIGIFVLVLSFMISATISGFLVKPLSEMTEKAKRLAAGDFSVDFKGNSYGAEMEELAGTLNYARDEISKADSMQKELIANVSHDFKTPLTMIKAYAAMIQEISGNDPVKREKHAQVIIDEADRLAALVNDVLDLSKISSGLNEIKTEIFDLSAFTLEILDKFGYLSETQGYVFETDVESKLVTEADRVKIGQVIYNLIGNAVNYTGEDKKVKVSLRREDGVIRLSVKDTGAGVPKEELPDIWNRYYRSAQTHKRPVKGSGLGLSIVKTVLDKHNFRYGVNSEEGKGSEFYVLFPLL